MGQPHGNCFIQVSPISAMKFKVILEEVEEGGYIIYVPSLPGCVSQGESKEEAVENIIEAIEVYLDIDDAKIEAEIQNKRAEVVEVTV
jgi:predicted RNase H-like HicB family nuclease